MPELDTETKQRILRRAHAIAADHVHETRQDAILTLALRCARVEIVGKELADEIARVERFDVPGG